MGKTAYALGMFLFAGTLNAAPIYLDCTTKSSDEIWKFSVKLDEASGKVTHSNLDGTAFTADGIFSTDTVSYKRAGINSLWQQYEVEEYQIDRNNLAVVRSFRVQSSENPDITNGFQQSGTCKLSHPKKRKF